MQSIYINVLTIALIIPYVFERAPSKTCLMLQDKLNGFILHLVKMMTITAHKPTALIIKLCLPLSNSCSSVNKQTKWPSVELISSSSWVL